MSEKCEISETRKKRKKIKNTSKIGEKVESSEKNFRCFGPHTKKKKIKKNKKK